MVEHTKTDNCHADMFIPSYGDRESSELERRPDPVHEIVLSEEDLRDIFPK